VWGSLWGEMEERARPLEASRSTVLSGFRGFRPSPVALCSTVGARHRRSSWNGDCHGQRSEEVEPGSQEAQENASREGEIRRGHRIQSNLEDADSTASETEIRPTG
jgi:hypothetical protein